MATAVRRHSIVNPARRRRNKPRRKMTAKQIRHFGTKRQKAALKAKRRHATRAVANPRRAPKRHRAAAHRRRTAKRSNPGEILSLTLGNPAKRRKKVAATKRNRRRRHAVASNPSRRHNRRRHNPVARRHHSRRHSMRHNRIRRNPGGLNVPSLVTDGLFVIGGLVGSRLLTQMVLGANNVGVWGYVGNAAAGGVLAAALAHGHEEPARYGRHRDRDGGRHRGASAPGLYASRPVPHTGGRGRLRGRRRAWRRAVSAFECGHSTAVRGCGEFGASADSRGLGSDHGSPELGRSGRHGWPL